MYLSPLLLAARPRGERLKMSSPSPSTAPAASAGKADDAIARLMAGAVGAGELDLSIGEPDQPLPDELADVAVASIRAGHTGYTPKLGLDELRQLIAADIKSSTGFAATPDNVIVTVGGTGAVAVAIEAVCSPSAGIVIPDPAWPNYRVLSDQLGIPVHTYAQGASGDNFLDLVAIEQALIAGARLVVVNSPSNPTGAVASPHSLAALVDLVRAHGAFILSDEAYESIVFSGGRAASPLTTGGDVTFAARTFSKTYSMTGLRVGSLLSPPEFQLSAAAIHGTTVGCAPITAQLVAIEALRSLAQRGARLAEVYAGRFAMASEILGAWMPPVDPQELGGFYLWLDASSTGRTAAELVAELRTHGIVVSTGEVYSPASSGFLRVALTAPDAELATALTTIATVLAA